MIKRLIWTIWTPMSSVLEKANKLNLSLSLSMPQHARTRRNRADASNISIVLAQFWHSPVCLMGISCGFAMQSEDNTIPMTIAHDWIWETLISGFCMNTKICVFVAHINLISLDAKLLMISLMIMFSLHPMWFQDPILKMCGAKPVDIYWSEGLSQRDFTMSKYVDLNIDTWVANTVSNSKLIFISVSFVLVLWWPVENCWKA